MLSDLLGHGKGQGERARVWEVGTLVGQKRREMGFPQSVMPGTARLTG
jgi:hypothetical protein